MTLFSQCFSTSSVRSGVAGEPSRDAQQSSMSGPSATSTWLEPSNYMVRPISRAQRKHVVSIDSYSPSRFRRCMVETHASASGDSMGQSLSMLIH